MTSIPIRRGDRAPGSVTRMSVLKQGFKDRSPRPQSWRAQAPPWAVQQSHTCRPCALCPKDTCHLLVPKSPKEEERSFRIPFGQLGGKGG